MRWRKLGPGYYKTTGPSGRTYWAERAKDGWHLREYGYAPQPIFATLGEAKQEASDRECFIERQVLAARGV